jgi:hypothetical protein
MPEHGDYDLQARKWYCGYWMTEEEWLDIHDYTPPILQEHDGSGPPQSPITAQGDDDEQEEEQ